MTLPYILGWLLLMAAYLFTQTRFYNAHRRVHGWWRPPGEAVRTTLLHTPAEYRAMWRATFQTDSNTSVERARRSYLLVLGLAIAYLVLAIPAAIVFGT